MRGVIATLLIVLYMMGCGADHASERSNTTSPPEVTPPVALQVDFPQASFNVVTGESPRYQSTLSMQILSAEPQQSITSQRYVMTVSMF